MSSSESETGSDFSNVDDVTDYEVTLPCLERVDGLSEANRAWLTGRSFRRLVGLE